MCAFCAILSRGQRQQLEHHLHTAQRLGQVHDVTCLLAILAVTDGQSCDQVARTLRVTLKTVHQWVRRLLVAGPHGLAAHKSRPDAPPN